MINTYNESSLHKSLKILYAQKECGQNLNEIGNLIEQKIQLTSQSTGKKHEYICDIVTKDKKVIEIQTASLHSLTAKILDLTASKIPVKVVHPIITVKYLQTFDELTKKTTVRKSPTKKNLYNGFFKELTAFTPLLKNKYFTLEVVETICIEERIKTATPVKSKNGHSRFPKNYVKTGKNLKELGQIYTFKTKKSWLSLLPSGLEKEFTVKDIFEKLTESGIKTTKNECNLLAWVLFHGQLITRVGKTGNSYKYSIV